MADWRLAVDIGGHVHRRRAARRRDRAGHRRQDAVHPVAPARRGEARRSPTCSPRPGSSPADVRAPIVHATTLVTNALIEGKTARAALVTNRGFADTLLIRNEHRYDMYDLQIEFAPPPIPRDAHVRGRRAHDGRRRASSPSPTTPNSIELGRRDRRGRRRGGRRLPPPLVRQPGGRATSRRPPAPAARRRRLRVERGRAADPRVPADGDDGVQRGDDAGRRSVPRRVPALARRPGVRRRLLIMLSNGGVVSAEVGRPQPDPDGGVRARPPARSPASWYARRLGEERLLCFDMGGTTAKSCLIEHHEPQLSTDFEVARDLPLQEGLRASR